MSAKSDYDYETDFEIWRENQKFEHQKNARSRPPLDLTPVGENFSNPKILTLTTDFPKHKEKAQQVCTIGSRVRPKFFRFIIEQI